MERETKSMTSLKNGKLVNDGDSVAKRMDEGKWHLCPICKLGPPKTDGVKCLDIMGHAAGWIVE